MSIIITAVITSAITAYVLNRIMMSKFIKELDTIEKKHRKEMLILAKETINTHE